MVTENDLKEDSIKKDTYSKIQIKCNKTCVTISTTYIDMSLSKVNRYFINVKKYDKYLYKNSDLLSNKVSQSREGW